MLPLPLWEWAPPRVRSKPCLLWWRVGCSPAPRIVLVRGARKKISRGPPRCCEACSREGPWVGWWPGWALTESSWWPG